MKKNHMKTMMLAASLSMTLTLAVPSALAVDISPSPSEIVILDLEPRFEHISQLSASLSISGLGRAACGGSFTTYDEYDSRMTMVLQQYTDSEWVDIKEWSQEYTGSGVKMIDKGYYVSGGYRYRMTVIVEILDSKGNVIETVSCDSPIKEY